LHGSFGVAPRETAYHLYDPTETPLLASCRDTLPGPGTIIECSKVKRSFARNSSRELVEVNGALGTSFGRVFSWDGEEIKRIKHVVEPEVKYLYVSRAGQSDIPIMDGVDRVNGRNLTIFSLTNRFWGRFAQITAPLEGDAAVEPVQSLATADTRELARLRFAVSYDMTEERKAGNRFSDVDIELRLRPKDYLALGAGTGISPNSGRVSQATALFSIADPRPITRRVLDRDFMRPNSLDLTYRFIGKTIDSPLIENANLFLIDPKSPKSCPPRGLPSGDRTFDPRCGIEKDVMGLIGMRGLFHITDHLLFLYDANYNANRRGFTTNRGSLKILSRCECWTLTFSLNRTTNPDDTNFGFSFDLLGLGSQAKEAFR
jgi:hypothetical protein